MKGSGWDKALTKDGCIATFIVYFVLSEWLFVCVCVFNCLFVFVFLCSRAQTVDATALVGYLHTEGLKQESVTSK